MNNAVFGKTMENVTRRNYLVTESNYHTHKKLRKLINQINEKNTGIHESICQY